MLKQFESFAVDRTIWKAIRNLQEDFRAHVSAEIRKAVCLHIGTGYSVDISLILSDGELIRLEGSDITHFAFQGTPLLAWTTPRMEVDGETHAKFTYRIGRLPPASEETLRIIKQA